MRSYICAMQTESKAITFLIFTLAIFFAFVKLLDSAPNLLAAAFFGGLLVACFVYLLFNYIFKPNE